MTSKIDVRDANPIFDLVEGGYYVGAWFLVGREQDFLGLVFRDPGATSLQFRYRFRYYADDKVHFDETDDVKNVYNCDLAGKTEDEVIAIVDGLASDLIARGYLGTRLPWLVKKRYVRMIVRGDHRAMTKALVAMPFTHTRPFKTDGEN
jgi:hypothetical protein